MSGASYKICTRCIMDTSDQSIQFDENGLCDYCRNFDRFLKPKWDEDILDASRLTAIAEKIKKHGNGKSFDCIIGLSGGLDSSYVAHVAKTVMGLRPLLVHVDAGWNTDQAVSNIEKLVDGLGLDLFTDVVDWPTMRDLQLAFLKSQIADQDLPQDAAFFSGLYHFARKHNIKYVITGSNYQTECCREPEAWGGYPGIDVMLFRDIHRKFGQRKPFKFKLTDILVYKVIYRYLLGMKILMPLNLIKYTKSEAEETLNKLYGWQKFQHKHHESRFTRFYEDYWLPNKFGYEKRRAHFSSLIMTGEMSRDDALLRISRPEMDEHFLAQEFDYVASKLGISREELRSIFDAPNKTFDDYRNKRWLIKLGAVILKTLGLERRFFR